MAPDSEKWTSGVDAALLLPSVCTISELEAMHLGVDMCTLCGPFPEAIQTGGLCMYVGGR
jgi:hypothetical protein